MFSLVITLNIIFPHKSDHIVTNDAQHFIPVLFYRIITEPRLIIFPALAINFEIFRKHFARFVTPLTAQNTSKLTENERNTGRSTTQSSGKGVND